MKKEYVDSKIAFKHHGEFTTSYTTTTKLTIYRVLNFS